MPPRSWSRSPASSSATKSSGASTTEIEKLVRDHARSRDKLANVDYLERAPPEVVAREHGRSEAAIQHLREQRRRVESLK